LTAAENDLVTNILQLIARTLNLIHNFKESFKVQGKTRPFKFNHQPYYIHLIWLSNVINGFVKLKGGKNHLVNEEGIVTS